MTNPTKQYAVGFSARAFLKPKYLSADKLFEWVDDDELKKLKPSPESVRDAILECKKHGLNARFSGGLALSISGDASTLFTCFGVHIASVTNPPASPKYQLENASGEIKEWVRPLAEHPLSTRIEGIIVEGEPESNAAPRFTGGTSPQSWARTDWGKQPGHPEHIWPHELQGRFLVNSKNLLPADVADFTNKLNANRYSICVLDSGANVNHPYIRWLCQTQNNNQSELYAPNLKLLFTYRTKLLQEALSVKEKLKKMFEHLVYVETLLLSPQTIRFTNNEVILLADQIPNLHNLNLPNLKPVERKDAIFWLETFIEKSEFFQRFKHKHKFGASLFNLLAKVHFKLKDPVHDTLTIKKNMSRHNWKIQTDAIMALRTFLLNESNNLDEKVRALNKFNSRGYDLDGHGTGMTASILGVSKASNVHVIPFISVDRITHWSFSSTFLSRKAVFEETEKWCEERQRVYKINHLNYRLDREIAPRVFSNSYGCSLRLLDASDTEERKQARAAYHNDDKNQIRDLTQKGYLLIFSSGNAFGPLDTHYNDTLPLTGAGAIIVGGAWDYDRTDPNNANTLITFADSAHGKVFEPYTSVKNKGFINKRPVAKTKTVRIPDICGFSGKQDSTGGAPYVYVPTAANSRVSIGDHGDWGWWSYIGGGTSSACAQIASICGALKAAYPNLSPKQVKKAIIEGGDDVTAGQSYQKVGPGDIHEPRKGQPQYVRIANILGAFQAARRMN